MSPPNDTRSALIVGAGIGGLAAGVALRKAGWTVRIHERATNARELGFGLALAHNALAALRELGVAEEVIASGVPTTAVEIRRADGSLLRRFNAQVGGPTVIALRPALYGALLKAIGPDTLRLSSDVRSFTVDSDSVTLTDHAGTTDRATLLIGADGVDSVVRRQLHPDEPVPIPSGYCAVRGVAFGVGGLVAPLAAVGYLDDGIEAATARASDDAIYWYFSLLARDLPATPGSPREILEPFLSRFEPRLRDIVAATKEGDLRYDPLFRRDPLPHWGVGPVTLLGDAAHPVLPHTGQGAAQALEDAVALGLAIARADRIEDALRRYEAVRSHRTRTFISAGPRIARMTTTHRPLVRAIRTAILKLTPERLLSVTAPSFRRDPHRDLR